MLSGLLGVGGCQEGTDLREWTAGAVGSEWGCAKNILALLL